MLALAESVAIGDDVSSARAGAVWVGEAVLCCVPVGDDRVVMADDPSDDCDRV